MVSFPVRHTTSRFLPVVLRIIFQHEERNPTAVCSDCWFFYSSPVLLTAEGRKPGSEDHGCGEDSWGAMARYGRFPKEAFQKEGRRREREVRIVQNGLGVRIVFVDFFYCLPRPRLKGGTTWNRHSPLCARLFRYKKEMEAYNAKKEEEEEEEEGEDEEEEEDDWEPSC